MSCKEKIIQNQATGNVFGSESDFYKKIDRQYWAPSK